MGKKNKSAKAGALIVAVTTLSAACPQPGLVSRGVEFGAVRLQGRFGLDGGFVGGYDARANEKDHK